MSEEIKYNLGLRDIKRIEKDAYNQALEDLFNKCKEKYPRNYANELELGGASCVFSLNNIETFKKELII